MGRTRLQRAKILPMSNRRKIFSPTCQGDCKNRPYKDTIALALPLCSCTGDPRGRPAPLQSLSLASNPPLNSYDKLMWNRIDRGELAILAITRKRKIVLKAHMKELHEDRTK